MVGCSKGRGRGKGLAVVAEALASDTDDCIEWPMYRMRNGYGQIGLYAGMALAHRYVCEQAHGPQPPDKPHAAHRCGVKACINPRHIRWASAVENDQDKHVHGTWWSRVNGKLDPEKVLHLRAQHAAGATAREIATSSGVPLSTVSKVVRRETWRHV